MHLKRMKITDLTLFPFFLIEPEELTFLIFSGFVAERDIRILTHISHRKFLTFPNAAKKERHKCGYKARNRQTVKRALGPGLMRGISEV